MKNHIISGRSWTGWGIQITEFTLSFQTKEEADAARVAINKVTSNVYLKPDTDQTIQQTFHLEESAQIGSGAYSH